MTEWVAERRPCFCCYSYTHSKTQLLSCTRQILRDPAVTSLLGTWLLTLALPKKPPPQSNKAAWQTMGAGRWAKCRHRVDSSKSPRTGRVTRGHGDARPTVIGAWQSIHQHRHAMTRPLVATFCPNSVTRDKELAHSGQDQTAKAVKSRDRRSVLFRLENLVPPPLPPATFTVMGTHKVHDRHLLNLFQRNRARGGPNRPSPSPCSFFSLLSRQKEQQEKKKKRKRTRICPTSQ